MLHSRQGLVFRVALLTKPRTDSMTAVEGARQYALPVVAIGVVIAILYFGRVFFITSMSAVVIAFILEPFVGLFMRLRLPRTLASFLVCAIALLLLYVVGMGAYSQLSALWSDLPRYGERLGDLIDNVQQKISGAEQQAYRLVVPARQRQKKQEEEQLRAQQAAKAPKRARGNPLANAPAAGLPPALAPGAPSPIPEVRIHEEERSPVSDFISARLSSFYQILLMASFVPFLVYFMLSWRDHINRSFLQFFHGEDRMVAARSLQGIADMVRAFVVGNFLLGLLLAALSSMVFWIIHVPFPLLVGPLSGFLSLIPYIGMPLAMLPPLFAALALNTFSVYVLVMICVGALHLVAMNLLYPKVVGSRVHLNPLVVTFSLMLWGFLWDAPGLLLAIPLTAGMKAVCDNVKGLRPIGKFLGD
jgi:predicted PurR-regulated permease PerM